VSRRPWLAAWLWLRGAPVVALSGLLLMATGIGLATVVVPREAQKLRELKAQGARLAVTTGTTPRPHEEPTRDLQKWQRFQAHLGDAAALPAQLNVIYGIAARHGLQLSTGQYKASLDSSRTYSTYEIRLPVDGSYPSLRGFCEDVLLALPNATLDSLSFKRDAAGSPTLQANTQFTLYLTPRNWPTDVRATGAQQ